MQRISHKFDIHGNRKAIFRFSVFTDDTELQSFNICLVMTKIIFRCLIISIFRYEVVFQTGSVNERFFLNSLDALIISKEKLITTKYESIINDKVFMNAKMIIAVCSHEHVST